MKIRLHSDASKRFANKMNSSASPTAIWGPHSNRYYDMLKKVDGQTLMVETKHLFSDQFNTPAIDGVSENGLRVMVDSVAEVIDDVRTEIAKCGYCGHCQNQVWKYCGDCKRGDSMRDFTDKTYCNGVIRNLESRDLSEEPVCVECKKSDAIEGKEHCPDCFGEVRSYGPGKFSLKLDAYVYSVALDGSDDECGESGRFGWFALLRHGHSIFRDNDPFLESSKLNPAEIDALTTSAGCILCEKDNGFVYVQYFSDAQELDVAWAEVLKENSVEEETEV